MNHLMTSSYFVKCDNVTSSILCQKKMHTSAFRHFLQIQWCILAAFFIIIVYSVVLELLEGIQLGRWSLNWKQLLYLVPVMDVTVHVNRSRADVLVILDEEKHLNGWTERDDKWSVFFFFFWGKLLFIIG